MSEHRSEYVGRHRKADPTTIPMKIVKFINERYWVHDDPQFLYTHQKQLHRKGNPKR